MLSAVSTSIGNWKQTQAAQVYQSEFCFVTWYFYHWIWFLRSCTSALVVALQYFELLGCVLCTSIICFLFASVSVSAHRHPQVWKSGVSYMLFGSVGKTDSVSRVLEGGFGMRRSSSGIYPSPCLFCPLLPLHSPRLLSFSYFSPFLLPPLPWPQWVLRRCSVPKWDCFSLLLWSLSPSPELTLKKKIKPHCWVTHSNNCCF